MKKIFIILIIGMVMTSMGCKKASEKSTEETHITNEEQYITLEANKISEYSVSDDIIEDIYSLQFNSGAYPCLSSINNIIPLSSANKINDVYACLKFKGENSLLYIISKHENESVPLTYGLLNSKIILIDKWRERSEFENIKQGTTLDKINSIDNTAKFKVQYAAERDLEKISKHYCKDGCYTIEWEENAEGEMCVKSIEFTNDRIIADIVRLGL